VHPPPSAAPLPQVLHTPQGVRVALFLLGSRAGPVGGSTPLLLLKRMVKMIAKKTVPSL